MRRVEIDGETKALLQRHGATTDDQYESIDPDVYIVTIDEQVFQFIEASRVLGQTWGEALKECLRYGQFLFN